jgi:ATP-binding cassette subfamily B protein
MLLNLEVDFIRSLALFTRIFEYLDRPHEIENPENPQKPDLDNSSVEFCDVHFSYEQNKEILKGVSFNVPKGKMYAIVGTSGAGKSTIIGMIPRLYDTKKGEVKVAGVNVKDFDLSYLRTNIGIVTQDTYLFNGTILENLLYAKPDATIEEIENACKVANIYDFIMTLPQKFDTVVGNRGLKLSGGEKQRVSIARVVLKDPKILILDEATSALDTESEYLVQQALERLRCNRTTFAIAHRLSTLRCADRIAVVDDHKIAEIGSHNELLKNKGIYYNLVMAQLQMNKTADKQ